MEAHSADKHYHHYTVSMHHALGKMVVHHLKDGEGGEGKGEEKIGKSQYYGCIC